METLSKVQLQEAREYVLCNRDVFSEMPGQTFVTDHVITTKPGERVKLKPYWISEAKWEAMHQVVKKNARTGGSDEEIK